MLHIPSSQLHEKGADVDFGAVVHATRKSNPMVHTVQGISYSPDSRLNPFCFSFSPSFSSGCAHSMVRMWSSC